MTVEKITIRWIALHFRTTGADPQIFFFRGVLGHAHVEDKPWLTIDETVNGLTAQIVGKIIVKFSNYSPKAIIVFPRCLY